MRKRRYLVTGDGQVFEGYAFGADCACVGELVFTTGMCGYMETLTDPSYYGQIVLQTFPLIGNYGAIPEDAEGACSLRGYVVREVCDEPSNFRCGGTLDAYLREQGVPGICGIDTRQLTRILREHGVMNAALCDTLPADMTAICGYAVRGAVEAVSVGQPYTVQGSGSRFRVALIDYGAKKNIVRELCRRGCDVTVLPCTAIWRAGMTASCCQTAPAIPRKTSFRSEKLPVCSDVFPCSAYVLGISSWRCRRAAGRSSSNTDIAAPISRCAIFRVRETARISPVRITAMPWCRTVSRRVWDRCAMSTPTTAPARAWTIPRPARFPCSSTPRRAPVRTIPPFFLTDSVQ